MNKDDILKLAAFREMSPEKQELISTFLAKSGKLSMDKAMPLLLALSRDMKSKGLSFTKAESELLIEAMMTQMTPEERSKVELMRKMMK